MWPPHPEQGNGDAEMKTPAAVVDFDREAVEARLAMMVLANMISVPMALTAVIKLGVPEAIHTGRGATGDSSPLSAAEIIPLLRTPPPPSNASSADILERLLRLLASHGVFAEQAGSPRRYSLTAIGRTLLPNGATGASYADYVLQHHQDALLRAWPCLHEAVLDPAGPEAFARANGGLPAYTYYAGDVEANVLMQKAMTGLSEPFMDAFLESYKDGFDGVKTLVDVGGSSGKCLELIMRRVKSIETGINFDLPDVVAAAPAIVGVKHVGGDMFNSIPAGDAIFMKWILTTWTDDECALILKNCYNVLPQGGKVIACEPVVPDMSDSSQRTRALLESDIFVMAMYRTLGRQRSEEEFRRIGLNVGFSGFRALYLDPFFAVLEFLK